MIGLPYGEKTNDNMLSRSRTIPERYGRTDRRTDIHNCFINIARHHHHLVAHKSTTNPQQIEILSSKRISKWLKAVQGVSGVYGGKNL